MKAIKMTAEQLEAKLKTTNKYVCMPGEGGEVSYDKTGYTVTKPIAMTTNKALDFIDDYICGLDEIAEGAFNVLEVEDEIVIWEA